MQELAKPEQAKLKCSKACTARATCSCCMVSDPHTLCSSTVCTSSVLTVHLLLHPTHSVPYFTTKGALQIKLWHQKNRHALLFTFLYVLEGQSSSETDPSATSKYFCLEVLCSLCWTVLCCRQNSTRGDHDLQLVWIAWVKTASPANTPHLHWHRRGSALNRTVKLDNWKEAIYNCKCKKCLCNPGIHLQRSFSTLSPADLMTI